MSKRYRLKVNLPGCGSEVEFTPTSALAYGAISNPHYHIEYSKEIVENNPQWFEEVVDRIEVFDIGNINRQGASSYYHGVSFSCTSPIRTENFPAIKQAIEAVLNDDSVFDAERLNAQIDKIKAMEDAFNAARAVRPLPFDHKVYPTFNDYLSALKSIQP